MRRVVAVLFATASAFGGVVGTAEAVFPGGNGKVAFSKAGLGGETDIWTMNPDGSGVVNLTQSFGYTEHAPAWSPDRTRIAFVRYDLNYPQIRVMNANGSEPKPVSTGACPEPRDPAWSPDGTKLTLTCRDGGAEREVWSVKLDGSSSVNLTNDGFSGANDFSAAWSPDGTQIAWVKGQDIWKMNADGTGKTPVVDNPAASYAADVTWSPDGTQLAFISTRDCPSCNRPDIFRVTSDGTGLTQLTETPDVPETITWSPDGTKLLFEAFTFGPNSEHLDDGLYTINSDGTGQVAFGGAAGVEASYPDWQVAGPPYSDPPPQPGQIAFAALRDHRDLSSYWWGYEIYSMDSDGSRQRRLTFNTWEDNDPSWSPNGTRIAFSSNQAGGPNNEYEIHVLNSDGSGEVSLTDVPVDTSDLEPTWSPDGTQIAFVRDDHPQNTRDVMVMNADGSGVHAIAPGREPDWSPDGQWIAFVGGGGISKMRPDGSEVTVLATGGQGSAPDWSPDGHRIAFMRVSGSVRNVWHMDANGDFETQYTFESTGAGAPTWSPDGLTLAYDLQGDIWVTRFGDKANLTNTPEVDESPDWQRIHGYPRPKGATPARFSLVTAYEPCTAPDREHGPPLAFESCSAPSQTSDYLTVGTGDSNGLPARNEGYVRFDSVLGIPATPADEADVRIEMFVDDVFTQALADYAGELRLTFSVRITDRSNAAAGTTGPAGTANDVPLAATLSCTPVADPQEGSSCSGTTTDDALIPGAVPESKRSIWQLDQVRVFDGGADGDGDTTGDNTLFATVGLFVP